MSRSPLLVRCRAGLVATSRGADLLFATLALGFALARRTFGLAGTIFFLVAVLMVVADDRAATMIGFIETRPFEDDACREEDTPDRPVALRADGKRLIGHFLPDFKTMIAAFTLIFIRWHKSYHPYLLVLNAWAWSYEAREGALRPFFVIVAR